MPPRGAGQAKQSGDALLLDTPIASVGLHSAISSLPADGDATQLDGAGSLSAPTIDANEAMGQLHENRTRRRKGHTQRWRLKKWKNEVQIPTPEPSISGMN